MSKLYLLHIAGEDFDINTTVRNDFLFWRVELLTRPVPPVSILTIERPRFCNVSVI